MCMCVGVYLCVLTCIRGEPKLREPSVMAAAKEKLDRYQQGSGDQWFSEAKELVDRTGRMGYVGRPAKEDRVVSQLLCLEIYTCASKHTHSSLDYYCIENTHTFCVDCERKYCLQEHIPYNLQSNNTPHMH